jgi:hypothetical protein
MEDWTESEYEAESRLPTQLREYLVGSNRIIDARPGVPMYLDTPGRT